MGRHVAEQTDTRAEQTIQTNFGADDGPVERFIMVDKPTHQRNCSNLSPPPRYSAHAPPVFELEDQPGLKPNTPVELVGSPPQSGGRTERIDPAELDTSSLPVNRVELDASADIHPIVPSNLVPAPMSSREFYSSIASKVKKRPAAINTQHRFTMASLQSEIFLDGGDNGRSNPASLDSPLIHPVSPLAPECDLMPHMSLEAVDDDHPQVDGVRPRSA
ncbi:hypothetical protein MPH_08426 [Macrophomina phaseolina MS6]|uniref:Uncharacterized protein n=1 Tax=Macrophomina phaseolina (strain MS6) TaxID=1126212 RepID=K2RNR3_MACPH|nr:hypothetical protein MPH_08426 [Macrophomina phaseolina MS6]